MENLYELLKENTYPGRGIVMARTPDGKAMMAIYFIMGRSENSRNRIFVRTDDGIRTEAYDPNKLTDPSLIIYHPARHFRRCFIVTNGDQTDTIRRALEVGETYIEALRSRSFEPDGPIFTPRISSILVDGGRYAMSILKSGDADGSFAYRYFYEYDADLPGQGHFIHTYQCDAPVPPSFSGEPVSVIIDEDCPNALAEKVWAALNEDNRVSLYVCRLEMDTHAPTDCIINKHQ